MPRIPKSPRERKALRDDYELRKLIAETEEQELKTARLKASESKSRVYTFYDDVEPESIRECMSELGVWSRQFPGQPLTVIFNSHGGYVDDGLTLYDFLLHLRAQGHHITTVALGRAYSMGAVLLQAGDLRVVGPNASLLVHEVHTVLEGKLSMIEDDLKYTKRVQERLVDILSRGDKARKKLIRSRWRKTEWWLDANEAVTMGFADEILAPQHSSVTNAKPRRTVTRRKTSR